MKTNRGKIFQAELCTTATIYFKPTYQVWTSEEQWISCINYLNYNVTRWRHVNKFCLGTVHVFLSPVTSFREVLCLQHFYLLSMTLHSCLQNSRFLSYGVRINFCSSSSLDKTLGQCRWQSYVQLYD